MQKEVNESSVKLVLKAIHQFDDYSFESFIKEHSLDKNAVKDGRNYYISCPFHRDSTPSLSINFKRNICKCFGCDMSGNFLQFKMAYDSFVTGYKYNFYTYLDHLLRTDPRLKIASGVSSVFRSKKDDVDLNNMQFRKKKLQYINKPASIIDFVSKQDVHSFSVEKKLLLIGLIQQGVPYDQLDTLMNRLEDKSVEQDIQPMRLDISNMIGD